jgi:hypothetical protein
LIGDDSIDLGHTDVTYKLIEIMSILCAININRDRRRRFLRNFAMPSEGNVRAHFSTDRINLHGGYLACDVNCDH